MQAVINATVSVDTFFLMSGLLVAYLLLRELDRNKGRFNVPLFYIHRYLRLILASLKFCTFKFKMKLFYDYQTDSGLRNNFGFYCHSARLRFNWTQLEIGLLHERRLQVELVESFSIRKQLRSHKLSPCKF